MFIREVLLHLPNTLQGSPVDDSRPRWALWPPEAAREYGLLGVFIIYFLDLFGSVDSGLLGVFASFVSCVLVLAVFPSFAVTGA